MPSRSRLRTAPIVTVAMVTYNSEKYVCEAIESVLAQEFTDFELLICDDASTDRTWSLVKQYSDPRIHAIRNLANIGEYPNRNQALDLARGKYFMFVDGDDYLYPHGLAFMVKMMERFPKAGFATAQPPSEKFIYPVELTPYQFSSCVFLGPIVFGADFTQLFFRTECLRAANGFDLRYRTGDTQIQFAMGMRENCLLINGGLAWWRRRPGQASERLTRDRWGLAEMARYGNEALAHRDCPLSSAEKRIAHANLSRMLMRNVAKFVLKGRLIHAARLLRHSGLDFVDWRYLFAKYLTPYLDDVSGENPIRIGIGASAPPFVPALEGMRRVRRITRASRAENRLVARWNSAVRLNESTAGEAVAD